ncbi:unnamed protein product [Nezara viridula]|uniref:BESS domain-containing protein n=1 Tax=Nezara viridula TaxID=85310 RepID=A0A9P0E3G3_NEZVI|nr:unnamed protein product [Nezara viridula]
MRCSLRPHFLTAAVGSSGSSTIRRGQETLQEISPLRAMHIHKMFKRMHKKHGGPPPPGMFHGMHGMWHHMMPKPHEMWHHTMPKSQEMWPPHKSPRMGHPMRHPLMFHKMHHKMHKKYHKKHHERPSSSSSSSSSESEDESLADGIDKVQIGEEQQCKENSGNENPAPPGDGADVCKGRFKCKKDKRFKSKDKKDKCKYCFKRMQKDGFNPCWMQCAFMSEPPCRDPRYNKGIFNLPPPETSSNTEEGRAETEHNAPEDATRQVQFEEQTGPDKTRIAGQRSLRRGQRRGDSIDYFMQSIAEQIKKLPEAKIAEAKLKILEVVNEMQLDTAPEQSTAAEAMVLENQQSQEHPESQSVS